MLIVAVTVSDDPSVTVDEDTDKSIVGADSFSVIVIVTDCVPSSVAAPPETPVIETAAISSSSYKLSSVGVNDTVPVVAPAEIVMSEIVA